MNSMEYILKRLYIMSEIPCYVYDIDNKCVFHTGAVDRKNASQDITMDCICDLSGKTKESGKPLVKIVYEIIQYGAFMGKDGRLYVFGPTAIRQPSPDVLFKFCREQEIAVSKLRLPVKENIQLLNVLAIANWSINGEMVTEDQIVINSDHPSSFVNLSETDIHAYQFSKAENELSHLNYEFERKYLKRIEDGDISYLKTLEYNQMNLRQKVGILTKNKGKQMEYMAISNITLLCRAGINGGLNPAEAYELAESYMQKVDSCHQNEYAISHLLLEAQKEFIIRVHEKQQRSQSNYIEMCKSLLAKSVYHPLSVECIAKEIGIDRSYLSRLFSKEMGMTIIQYGMKLKVKAAANMLKYSNYPIAIIAEYLSFSSQSHMGKEFKKEMGMTPSEYRKKHKINDFI